MSSSADGLASGSDAKPPPTVTNLLKDSVLVMPLIKLTAAALFQDYPKLFSNVKTTSKAT